MKYIQQSPSRFCGPFVDGAQQCFFFLLLLLLLLFYFIIIIITYNAVFELNVYLLRIMMEVTLSTSFLVPVQMVSLCWPLNLSGQDFSHSILSALMMTQGMTFSSMLKAEMATRMEKLQITLR